MPNPATKPPAVSASVTTPRRYTAEPEDPRLLLPVLERRISALNAAHKRYYDRAAACCVELRTKPGDRRINERLDAALQAGNLCYLRRLRFARQRYSLLASLPVEEARRWEDPFAEVAA